MFTSKMKKNKKSQAEIVGLAIIVILITIGLLFFVKFGILDKKDDVKSSFIDSELANNMVDVLLKTTTDCKGSDIGDLLQDCTTFERFDCDGMNSCEKLNKTIDIIFGKTLKKWKKPYEFKAYRGSDIEIKKSYGNYNRNSAKKQGIAVIPTDMGNLFITLDIYS